MSETKACTIQRTDDKNVAKALNVDTSKVCIKATTEEGLGFTGEGLGISSQAIALLEN